ncbi:transmembrane alpha-helix domain-containing protein [Rutstroemia sp. NJR-2017a BBW]|nr:transmembrane alpha-helix domain-containing protein [Rutstroemia sp. NJR-2017a BBW]
MSRNPKIRLLVMPSPAIILLFSSIFGSASAVPWAVAKATATYNPDEWSPRPTNTPLAARDIFKRSSVDVDVCGWIGGNSAQPVGCASGSSCIHDTLGFVGCCPTSSAGASPIPCTDGLYTTCIDKNSAGYSANSFLINNGVLSCPAASSCYRIIYPESYTQFGCGASGGDITADTSFAGQATDLRLQFVYTGVSFDPAITIQNPSIFGAATSFPTRTASTTASSPDSTASATAGKASLTNSGPQSTTSAASSGSKGKSNTGAIVGGTIGGLVVVIGVALLAFFLIKRKGNHRKSGVSRGVSSPKRPSKATFEAIPNPTPSPQPTQSPIPFNSPATQPHEYVSPMSTTTQGYAPIYQSPYHRPTTPQPVEAPTPDPYVAPQNFRSPSPHPGPFDPPQSQILPSSYDPIRSRNLSRSPDPHTHSPYMPSSEAPNPPYLSLNLPQTQSPLLPQHLPSSPHPPGITSSPSLSLPIRRPTPTPPTLNTSIPPSRSPSPQPPQSRNTLPPLDLLDDTQTPLVPNPPPTTTNWHLALTGDRRTYAPSDNDTDILLQPHDQEPMPAIPALYAGLTHDLGIESLSPPAGSFFPDPEAADISPGAVAAGVGMTNGTKRNFSRKGRAGVLQAISAPQAGRPNTYARAAGVGAKKPVQGWDIRRG